MKRKPTLIDFGKLWDAIQTAGIKPKSLEGILLERPVAEAVEFLSIGGEPIVGSGFKNGNWAIIFHGKVSPEVRVGAEDAELKLTIGRFTTVLSLPGVKKNQPAKAKDNFHVFTYFYLEALAKKLGVM